MKCKSCEKEISEDFKLCPYCGEPVSSDEGNESIIIDAEPEKKLSPDALKALRIKLALEKQLSQKNTELAADAVEDQIDVNDSMETEEQELVESSEDEEENIEEKRKKDVKKSKNKKGVSKKGIFITIFMLIIVLFGISAYFYLFQGKVLNQDTKNIEAGSVVEPLKLVTLSKKDYSYEVAKNNINANVPGEYTVVYTVKDKQNKQSEQTFTFKVVDTTPPEIKAVEPIQAPLGKEFDLLKIITVNDIVDGVIDTKNVTVTGTVDISKAGTYPITLAVGDKAGNKTTKTLNVEVINKGDPVAFFENITGTWVNYSTKMVCSFRLNNGIYFLSIGLYQSEGFAEGALAYKDVNGDNTIGNFNWDYTTYTTDTGSKVYSAVTKRTVIVDTGVPKDDMISIDLSDGRGSMDYEFLSN